MSPLTVKRYAHVHVRAQGAAMTSLVRCGGAARLLPHEPVAVHEHNNNDFNDVKLVWIRIKLVQDLHLSPSSPITA